MIAEPLAAGIVSFSILLFLISFVFARKVIRPIEAISERERSFARHVAHELKTPLAVAKGDIELALAETKGRKERLKSALEEIASLRQVTDSLLFLSVASESLKRQRLDVRQSVLDEIAKTGQGSRFLSDALGELTVSGDPELFSILLRNILKNALLHSPAEAVVSVWSDESGFSVSNTAPKTLSVDLSRSFEPYYGTPGKGSGIGLSLVRSIADAHGWTVGLRREKGNVVFRISF